MEFAKVKRLTELHEPQCVLLNSPFIQLSIPVIGDMDCCTWHEHAKNIPKK